MNEFMKTQGLLNTNSYIIPSCKLDSGLTPGNRAWCTVHRDSLPDQEHQGPHASTERLTSVLAITKRAITGYKSVS